MLFSPARSPRRLGRGERPVFVRCSGVALALAVAVAAPSVPLRATALSGERSAAVPHARSSVHESSSDRASWLWPVADVHLVAPFAAPAGPYAAGHRGIDVAGRVGEIVRAPAAGTIAFAGPVAGRGIVTIDHGDGLVTTFEPVTSGLAPGAPVTAGDDLGAVSVGGHTAPGALHFGVRLHGEYINPLLLLGELPRAVLLPCCAS